MAQRIFDRLSERGEWLLASWWGAGAYLSVAALSAVLWGWDGLDRFIFLSGALVLVMLVGSGRRDSKAVHAKLDRATPGEDMNRIEELTEREIEELRK